MPARGAMPITGISGMSGVDARLIMDDGSQWPVASGWWQPVLSVTVKGGEVDIK